MKPIHCARGCPFHVKAAMSLAFLRFAPRGSGFSAGRFRVGITALVASPSRKHIVGFETRTIVVKVLVPAAGRGLCRSHNAFKASAGRGGIKPETSNIAGLPTTTAENAKDGSKPRCGAISMILPAARSSGYVRRAIQRSHQIDSDDACGQMLPRRDPQAIRSRAAD